MHGNSLPVFPIMAQNGWGAAPGGRARISVELCSTDSPEMSDPAKIYISLGHRIKSRGFPVAMETESFICSLYFLPLLWVCFLLFTSLQLSRQHLGVLWNKCYPLKAHCCLPERKMASYWKQYVMVIAVLFQVMPLKNVRDLLSSNWWWGKAQLKQKINCCIIFYSFKHHHTMPGLLCS